MLQETSQSIKEKIDTIVKEILNQEEELLSDDNLRDLGLDSLNTVELVVEIESFYNIEFSDDELLFDNFSSINQILIQVEKKLEAKNV